MTQKPAYTPAEVIAAGMTMRARGVEPERSSLWAELGRRGQSGTPWKVWLAHRDDQLPARVDTDLDGKVQSAEMTSAIEGHNRALATVIACAKAEAEAPLLQRVEMMEKALTRESMERQNLERLVDELEAELVARDALLAQRAYGTGPRLILP
ncbi:hypothetical protein PARPLA_00883 [Rhodobacteraceae bacterium THAF1]|uniref:DNA-binding protein n=1 Tax=Palleronia sp. THAF1 TaxID=2587842 RepID=UPI000F3F3977|nr:DNA-binding protein [Palleronia sp. THAF1]QFU07173.1 hypothetical protein FIU81_00610 [Palleronia sp. THAF1]VDC19989.1 hypothetical protein PARPLA_00883 [Rhodobacteraceae bacterium THAF1]